MLFGDVLFIEVNVSLGHTQIRMPHKVLQTKQVSTVLEKECCKAVTELIRGQFDAAILAMVSKRLVELRDGQLLPLIAWKQPILPIFRLLRKKGFQKKSDRFIQISDSARSCFGCEFTDNKAFIVTVIIRIAQGK